MDIDKQYFLDQIMLVDLLVKNGRAWAAKCNHQFPVQFIFEMDRSRLDDLRQECIRRGFAEYINGEFVFKEKSK